MRPPRGILPLGIETSTEMVNNSAGQDKYSDEGADLRIGSTEEELLSLDHNFFGPRVNSAVYTQYLDRDSVRRELAAILERLDAADKKLHRAVVLGQTADREAAEAERREAMGEYWAAKEALAKLFMLLLRQAKEHYLEALRLHLIE